MKAIGIIVACLAVSTLAASQPPSLDGYLQAVKYTSVVLEESPNYYKSSMASDGYGHHYATVKNNRVEYYLFDNSGGIIRSYDQFPTGSDLPSVTAYAGRQHIVLKNGNTIELYRSTDIGVTWNLHSFQNTFGSVECIDAYEDLSGVHIAYGSSGIGGGVKYHLRTRQPDEWANLPVDVSDAPLSYNRPSVIGGSDSAHVLTTNGFYSIKIQGGTAWTQPQGFVGLSAGTMAIAGNDLHAITWAYDNDAKRLYNIRRPLTGGNWIGFSEINNGVEGGNAPSPWKPPSVGIFEGSDFFTPYRRVVTYALTSSSFVFMNGIAGNTQINTPGILGSAPVVSAAMGSVVSVWKTQSGENANKATFRRVALGIRGDLTENYQFTDTNWLVGATTLVTGRSLVLKSGSVTYLLGEFRDGTNALRGPGKLVVAQGATLVVEGNAKLYLLSPNPGETKGGTLELGNNVVATIYGTVEAKPGSKFRFGDGASMNISGEFEAKGGSYTNPVVFERTGSGTWDGLVFTGTNVRNDTIEYARFSNTKTAISIQSKSTLRLASTVFDNSIIGVEVVNATGDMYREIKNCRFNTITGSGVSISNQSNTLMDTDTIYSSTGATGIFLNGSSPKILRTRVYNGQYALYCSNASSPLLEDVLNGGNNKFVGGQYVVACSNGSNAVLGLFSGAVGDVGGQNTFTNSDGVLVVATGASVVLAEKKLLGIKV